MQESNPDARAPPGFRDRCLHLADLTFHGNRARGGNRTRVFALKERRPGLLDHASLRASGWIRTSPPNFGDSGHVLVRRQKLAGESNPAAWV